MNRIITYIVMVILVLGAVAWCRPQQPDQTRRLFSMERTVQKSQDLGPTTSLSTSPTNPIAFTKGTVFTTNSGTTNWVYVPNSYDSTHATPTKLLVWLHGCGRQSQYDVSMVSPGGTQSWISLTVGGAEGACWNVNTDSAKVLAALAEIKTPPAAT